MPRRVLQIGLFVLCLFTVASQAQQTPFQATLTGGGVILNGMAGISTATGTGAFILTNSPGRPGHA